MVKIEPGQVIHCYIDSIIPPKKKFIVCIEPELNIFLFINSKNRINYECIGISANKYAFLKHDSFISCSNIIKISKEKLLESALIDIIDKDDINRILTKIAQSVRFPRKVKNSILKSRITY